MPDWTEIAKAAIPAAITTVGAIAGGKSRGAATQRSQEVVDRAYREALQAYNQAHGQATDINNWMLQSSFAPLNFGYGQSRADLQNALLGAQQGIAGGQANIADILGPYTGAGRKATGETNFLLYGQRPETGGGGAPGGPGAPGPSPNFNLPPNFGQGFNIAAPPGMGGPRPGGTSAGPENVLSSFAPHLADNRVKSGNLGTIGSTVGGIAGTVLGGPVGGMIGSTLGGLTGRLTRHGREKEAASNAVNEHSDWFWNDVVPTAQKEGWTADQLNQVAQSGWNDYSNWLGQNLKDQGVLQNSLASQRDYFNKGLASNPYTSQFGIKV